MTALTVFTELQRLKELNWILQKNQKSRPNSTFKFLQLPSDIISEILQYLSYQSLFLSKRVCKMWSKKLFDHVIVLSNIHPSSYNMNHKILFQIVSKMRNIRTLDLRAVRSCVDDEFLAALGNAKLNLQHLNFCGCDLITNKGLKYISRARFLKNLSYLNLRFCQKINSTGLQRLLRKCHNLHQLDFSGTDIRKFPHTSLKSKLQVDIWCVLRQSCQDLTEIVPPDELDEPQHDNNISPTKFPKFCSRVDNLSGTLPSVCCERWKENEKWEAGSKEELGWLSPYIWKFEFLKHAVASSVEVVSFEMYDELDDPLVDDAKLLQLKLVTSRGTLYVTMDVSGSEHGSDASVFNLLCKDPIKFCVDALSTQLAMGEEEEHIEGNIRIVGRDDDLLGI